MNKENGQKPSEPMKIKYSQRWYVEEFFKKESDNLTELLQNLQNLINRLNTLDEATQKKFASDLELRGLAFGSIVKIVIKSTESKPKKTDNQPLDLINADDNEVLNKLADFFNIFPKQKNN